MIVIAWPINTSAVQISAGIEPYVPPGGNPPCESKATAPGINADADADTVERLQPSGATSLALHRLTRMTRLNIMLEQKLIADLRSPKTETAPKPEATPKPRDKAPAEPSRWAKFGAGSELDQRKEDARELTRDSADTDERLDREDVEALMAELEAELASGKHDKDLRKEWGNDAAEKFLKARGIKPNIGPGLLRAQAAMEAASNGLHADGTPRLRPAEFDELEAGDSSATSPQPGDLDGATEPSGAPSGAGPPRGSG